MSKNITKTVIQPYAPTDKGVLWFDGRDLRIFHNGVWRPFKSHLYWRFSYA